MKTYDVSCPICGTENHHLYLEETGGWMECEFCHQTVQLLIPALMKRIPLYSCAELAEKVAAAAK